VKKLDNFICEKKNRLWEAHAAPPSLFSNVFVQNRRRCTHAAWCAITCAVPLPHQHGFKAADEKLRLEGRGRGSRLKQGDRREGKRVLIVDEAHHSR
jgi:hypothetical protein